MTVEEVFLFIPPVLQLRDWMVEPIPTYNSVTENVHYTRRASDPQKLSSCIFRRPKEDRWASWRHPAVERTLFRLNPSGVEGVPNPIHTQTRTIHGLNIKTREYDQDVGEER